MAKGTEKELEEFWQRVRTDLKRARCATVPMLSIEEIASKIGTSVVSVYNWENGTRKPPIKKLFLWAKATGVKLEIRFV